jgi:hypothetical protein
LNTELMLQTADAIEANPKDFDMSHWHTCIAGFACRTAGLKMSNHCTTLTGIPMSVASAAEFLLGIDGGTSYNLFHVTNWPFRHKMRYVMFDKHSAAKAAASYLRSLAKENAPEPEPEEERELEHVG